MSDLAKVSIWRLESDRYALTLPSTFDLGMQLPGYYGEGVDPNMMSTDVMLRLRSEAWDRFLHTDMFFVKVSPESLPSQSIAVTDGRLALGPTVYRPHDPPPPQSPPLS